MIGIDYTKRPTAAPRKISPSETNPAKANLTKISLTKASPGISLTKQTGRLGVNLNWDARLDGPQADLETELRRLSDELAGLVDSYLGLRITITGDAGPVSISTWHDPAGPAAVGTTLLIPLPLFCAAPPGSALILHAAQPGAFVDLTTDLSFALDEPLPTFVLDHHLTEHPDRNSQPELIGLAESSQINQAIGVLLACGRTREQALTELWHRANDVSGDLHAAADAIIKRAEHRLPHPP